MVDTRYLKRRGQTWSVVVGIPRPLQEAVGKKHFVQALHTRDLAEADRKKHHWVSEFKRRIEALRRSAPDPDREIREAALKLRALLDQAKGRYSTTPDGERISEHEEVLSILLDRAQEIADEDPAAAERFFDMATGRATPLAGLWPQWLNESEYTPHTKAQHEQIIKEYLEWAGSHATLEEVDKRRAGQYLSHMLQGTLARITIRRKLTSLRTFWRWCEARGLTEKNPWAGVNVKAKVTNPRDALDDETVLKLLRAKATDPIYSLIRIGLLTGCRIEELCSLKSANVECREDGWWLTIEKGKTEAARREVPVHRLLDQIITRLKATGTEFLFGLEADQYGKFGRAVSRLYSRWRKRIGVAEKRADFHALRNTFIAMMEGEGVPESTVKLLVGHKRASMTYGRYSKGERVNLRRAIERAKYSEEIMGLLKC